MAARKPVIDESLHDPSYTFAEVIDFLKTTNSTFQLRTMQLVVDSEQRRYHWFEWALIEYAFKIKKREL